MSKTDTKIRTPRAGDVLYTSWGYDQTNAEFFEVVGLTPSGKSVRLRRIEGTVKDGRVYPVRGAYTRDWLIEGNDTMFKNGEWVPNPKRVKGDELGYTEVVRRWKSGRDDYFVRISEVRTGFLYDDEKDRGVYDTYAAGLPGH